MLEYRRSCERCGRELSIDDHEVYICSFECTWCAECVAGFPRGTCPNCGGNLALRPIRPRHLTSAVTTATTTGQHPHSDCRRYLARTA